jgi:hypothetical protein
MTPTQFDTMPIKKVEAILERKAKKAKNNAAASKIQTFIRFRHHMKIFRKHMKSVSKMSNKIKGYWKIYLAKKEKKRRLDIKVTKVQTLVRGFL